MPVQGQFVLRRLGLAMVNISTKFELSSLKPFPSRYLRRRKIYGSRDVVTPILGTVCHL